MRFLAWINRGHVTLTLNVGETITHCTFEPDEEGYSASRTVWEGTPEGVLRHTDCGGCDCDGPIWRSYVDFCPWDELNTDEGPRWREYQESRTYDYYAQLDGY